MPILDRITGQWKKTEKEQERDQAKGNLQAKVDELQIKLTEQKAISDQLTIMMGDILLGGGL